MFLCGAVTNNVYNVVLISQFYMPHYYICYIKFRTEQKILFIFYGVFNNAVNSTDYTEHWMIDWLTNYEL
jgi:hypothetical protein